MSNYGVSQVMAGIPIPERTNTHRRYPFGKMKVGESFIVYCLAPDSRSTWNSLVKCKGHFVRKYKRDTGKSVAFTMRRVSGGIAVWRIQ